MQELFAGGEVRVVDDATGDARVAAGLWHIRASGKPASIDVVLSMPSEAYVTAVLNAEAAPDEPAQSLRALAVVARTYALNGAHYKPRAGGLPADLCDSTQCQAMRLAPARASVEEAVRATAGETIWSGNVRAEVFFSQDCGGRTEDASAIWPRLTGHAYLASHPDPYCLRRTRAEWHGEVSLQDLAVIAGTEGWHLPGKIDRVVIAQRSGSGRAVRLKLSGQDGPETFVSASSLRFAVGRALGWNRLRSDWYEITVRDGHLVFDGRGYGNGVGLCQVGALEMAGEGKSYRDILAFYFPGTEVRVLREDGGWLQIHRGSLDIRAIQHLSAPRLAELDKLWDEARLRFPPKATVQPELVFAPTTEMFRQLSGEPGWALASTRNAMVVFQPQRVLYGNGRDPSGTILHELLHVLVESEATPATPLWLREGLVEVLAHERRTAGAPGDIAGIDAGLRDRSSQIANVRAHKQAQAAVQLLVDRYGVPAVRGWLKSGVPASVKVSS